MRTLGEIYQDRVVGGVANGLHVSNAVATSDMLRIGIYSVLAFLLIAATFFVFKYRKVISEVGFYEMRWAFVIFIFIVGTLLVGAQLFSPNFIAAQG